MVYDLVYYEIQPLYELEKAMPSKDEYCMLLLSWAIDYLPVMASRVNL